MDSLTDPMGLKVRELLKEVQLDSSSTKTLDRAVASIIEAIRAIPDQEVSSEDAPGFVRDLCAPAGKVRFTFKGPDSIKIGGSRSIGAIVKPDVSVDLLVRLPKECFHEKDYLDHRYHAKRGLYLKVIERNLISSSLVKKIEWSSFQNEARKPVLNVYPAIEIAELSEFFIKIIPSATSLFNVKRLSLSRNNVRAFKQGDNTGATPNYNSSILEDMFLEENTEFVGKAFREWKSLEEALVLLKVWARNRTSIYAHNCICGYLISVVLSYLAISDGRHISRSMNAMQIFRVTLKFISTNLWSRGLFLNPPRDCNMSKEDVAKYLHSFDVVLCDASGHVNLTFRMTETAFSELQEEASWTLNCINKCGDGGFEEIFLTKVDFAAKFDSCLRINLKGNVKVNALGFCMDDERWRICEKDVHSLLHHGLTDRAKLIRVIWKGTPSLWNMEDGFGEFGSKPMIVGILLTSHEKSIRQVDRCPHDDKDEVVKFRKFWGEKAEIRGFEDGIITECTSWECEPLVRHLIMKQIVEHILIRHFLLSKEDMVFIVDQLDFCLQIGGKDPISSSVHLSGAFDILSQRLRLLDEIPLKISSVQALGSALRQTSVFPPEPLVFEKGFKKEMPKFAASCIQPVEIMIQLEGSGNWPLDIVAIEKTKTAFLLKIGESLQKRWGMFCTATEDAVDVFTSGPGYAFRLKIMHERGLNLVRAQDGNDKVKSIASVDKELFLRSQHSSMLHGLHRRFPIYGPVVRLAKRWISSHLFSSFLSEEAIELVVAYLFLKPFPFHAPCSRVTGFLRFLRLLSNYGWSFSPLIVDINDDFTSKDEKEINDNFILARKSYEGDVQDFKPAMFLATTYDRASEAWTKISPNRSVLKRMASYAQSSADLLTNLIIHCHSSSYTWECLFRTPLNNYDAVVLLHRDKLSYPQRLLFPSEIKHGKHVIHGKASKDFEPNLFLRNPIRTVEDAMNKLLIDFDPTRYFVEDLKRDFPDTFKVWYDSLGGDAIGLTWEKNVSKKRNRGEADEISKESIELLKSVGEIGKGYVRSIYLLKARKLQR